MRENVFNEIMDDLVSRLEADSFFADIPVMSQDRESAVTDIEQALNGGKLKGGKVGMAVAVMSPRLGVEYPNVPNSPLFALQPVWVMEQRNYNWGTTGTHKTALAVACRVVKVLGLSQAPGFYGLLENMKEEAVSIVDDAIADIVYEVRFRVTIADNGGDTSAAMPSFSVAGASLPKTITLATTTAGADIYYTLDRSFPSAVNAAAMKYIDPFVVSTACTIRAGAFLGGCIGSDINLIDIA
jgi:hypothetical protein